MSEMAVFSHMTGSCPTTRPCIESHYILSFIDHQPPRTRQMSLWSKVSKTLIPLFFSVGHACWKLRFCRLATAIVHTLYGSHNSLNTQISHLQLLYHAINFHYCWQNTSLMSSIFVFAETLSLQWHLVKPYTTNN